MPALRSPRHGLTACFKAGVLKGWVKSIQGQTKWIVDAKRAPDGASADKVYEQIFKELWRDPVQPAHKRMTILMILDAFVVDADRREIHPRTAAEYTSACQDFVDFIKGRAAYPDDLTPAIFADFAAKLRERFGIHRLKKWMICIRCAFNWAVESRLLDRVPHYGPGFTLPDKTAFRQARIKSGTKLYSKDEVAALIRASRPTMRAMILLALNGGMGNTDVSGLSRSHLVDDWVVYPRPKTGIARRFNLWPETASAIAAVDVAGEKIFTTRGGLPYVVDGKDGIGMMFLRTARRANVPNHGFYALRHTHRTISDELADQRAAALIMGHEIGDTASLYLERIDDARLRRLTDHVRTSLAIPEACAACPIKGHRRKSRRRRRAAKGLAEKIPAPASAASSDEPKPG